MLSLAPCGFGSSVIGIGEAGMKERGGKVFSVGGHQGQDAKVFVASWGDEIDAGRMREAIEEKGASGLGLSAFVGAGAVPFGCVDAIQPDGNAFAEDGGE